MSEWERKIIKILSNQTQDRTEIPKEINIFSKSNFAKKIYNLYMN